jgi:hypothetical protein
MRSVGLLLLVAVVALAPGVQAQACSCGAAPEAAEVAPACCCGDADSCRCAGCAGHEPTNGERLSGCVCTETQPQAGPYSTDDVEPAEAVAAPCLAAPSAPAWSIEPVGTVEGDARPPCSLPLLI